MLGILAAIAGGLAAINGAVLRLDQAGKLTEEQFAAWHKAAKARKKDRDREVISLDEFKAWLRDS